VNVIVSSFNKRDFIKQMESKAKGQHMDNALPCPRCESSVPIPVEAVLFGKDFSCPNCGLTITLTGDAPAAENIADTLEKGFK
jgi:transcription elongation factor Elf1